MIDKPIHCQQRSRSLSQLDATYYRPECGEVKTHAIDSELVHQFKLVHTQVDSMSQQIERETERNGR